MRRSARVLLVGIGFVAFSSLAVTAIQAPAPTAPAPARTPTGCAGTCPGASASRHDE